jgi:D-glycero-alpha-D-manno-heptose-7-phosphate kinase
MFNDTGVSVFPIYMKHLEKWKLLSRLGIFHTGITRDSREILQKQRDNIGNNYRNLLDLVLEAELLYQKLITENVDYIETTLNNAWRIKKSLASAITNREINEIYEIAKNNGATAGKILGAGGGGFILFYSVDIPRVRNALSRYGIKMIENLDFDSGGTECIYNM